MEDPACHAGNFWTSRMNHGLDSLAQKAFLSQPENHRIVWENYIVAFLVTLTRHLSFSEVNNTDWVANHHAAARKPSPPPWKEEKSKSYLDVVEKIFPAKEVSGVKVPGPWRLTWQGQLPVLQPHCLACAAGRGVLGWCTLTAQGAYCRTTPGASPPLNHTLSSRVKTSGYLSKKEECQVCSECTCPAFETETILLWMTFSFWTPPGRVLWSRRAVSLLSRGKPSAEGTWASLHYVARDPWTAVWGGCL